MSKTLTPTRVDKDKCALVDRDFEPIVQGNVLPLVRAVPMQHRHCSELKTIDKLSNIRQPKVRLCEDSVFKGLVQYAAVVIL
jgi:hypothetical protein